jgi:GNAT superfamily N-acetyltransferase
LVFMLVHHPEGYTLSDAAVRLDLDLIHGFLTGSYWSPGIGRDTVARAIRNSMAFGIYHDASDTQVGFCRIISDRATFAYLADVFVLEDHRGRGLARWMVAAVRAHPELQGLRRWILATRDAHAVYAAVGFAPLAAPERFMEVPLPKPATP